MIVTKKVNRVFEWLERDATGGVINERITRTWYLFGLPIYRSIFNGSNEGAYKVGDKKVGF